MEDKRKVKCRQHLRSRSTSGYTAELEKLQSVMEIRIMGWITAISDVDKKVHFRYCDAHYGDKI